MASPKSISVLIEELNQEIRRHDAQIQSLEGYLLIPNKKEQKTVEMILDEIRYRKNEVRSAHVQLRVLTLAQAFHDEQMQEAAALEYAYNLLLRDHEALIKQKDEIVEQRDALLKGMALNEAGREVNCSNCNNRDLIDTNLKCPHCGNHCQHTEAGAVKDAHLSNSSSIGDADTNYITSCSACGKETEWESDGMCRGCYDEALENLAKRAVEHNG